MEAKKNVVLCGYQKSGTTWATRLVAQLLDAPSAGYWNYDGKTFVVEGEERKSNYNVYQSHQLHKDLVNDKRIHKIIYIVRDPRDIVTSGSFHFNFYSKSLVRLLKKLNLYNTKLGIGLKLLDKKTHTQQYKICRMIKMLEQGDPIIDHCHWSWNDHVTPYLNDKNILLIKYEDLLLNGIPTAQKILAFFNKEKLVDHIKADLEQQSFKQKKKEFKDLGEVIKDKHMRKGVVGDWKQYLSHKETTTIQNNHIQLLNVLEYN